MGYKNKISEEEKKDFGIKLKAYRKKIGWTQKEMAEQLGFPNRKADFSKYEIGLSFPSGKVLKEMSIKFGVDQFF